MGGLSTVAVQVDGIINLRASHFSLRPPVLDTSNATLARRSSPPAAGSRRGVWRLLRTSRLIQERTRVAAIGMSPGLH